MIQTMKQFFILSTVLICFVSTAKAQECNIQIQILENKYMFGQASTMDDKEAVKKMEVNFTS